MPARVGNFIHTTPYYLLFSAWKANGDPNFGNLVPGLEFPRPVRKRRTRVSMFLSSFLPQFGARVRGVGGKGLVGSTPVPYLIRFSGQLWPVFSLLAGVWGKG